MRILSIQNAVAAIAGGGCGLTDSDEVAERMRGLRDHVMNPNRRYYEQLSRAREPFELVFFWGSAGTYTHN